MEDKKIDINDLEPETLAELSEELLVQYYTAARTQKEEIEAAMQAVSAEVISRLDAAGVKGKIVGDQTVTKATRVSFKTSLDEARELGAVKEAVDTTKLKGLHDSGAQIPGASVTTYLLVKALEKGDE